MNVTMSHGSDLVQSAFERTGQVSQRLARGDMSELPRDVVELTKQKHAVSIGASLIRVADEMTGSLLDVLG